MSMDLNTRFELAFGLIATILALFALWFMYKERARTWSS